MQETETIYVALLDEGTDVWRPVQAEKQIDGSYIIISYNDDLSDEKWEFSSGSRVICEQWQLSSGLRLVAISDRNN